MRTFNTGATRDDDSAKPDYDGFLSPLALPRYAKYMSAHRIQADGKLRDSDNWQKGIPLEAYMKSLFRHVIDVWCIHRGIPVIDNNGDPVDLHDALCAVIFNAFGYMHEHIIAEGGSVTDKEDMLISESNPSYSVVCKYCKYFPASCGEAGLPLTDPCPSFEIYEEL